MQGFNSFPHLLSYALSLPLWQDVIIIIIFNPRKKKEKIQYGKRTSAVKSAVMTCSVGTGHCRAGLRTYSFFCEDRVFAISNLILFLTYYMLPPMYLSCT